MELRENFEGAADGTPSTSAATGQTMTDYAPAGSASVLTVTDGFLSTFDPPNASFGSYRIAQLTGDVVRVGARFAFTPWTVAGGVMCLSIQAASIATDPAVPVCPLHFQITPTDWKVDVNDTAGTAVETVAAGTFAAALTADTATMHSVEAILDRDRGTCHLSLPDGQQVTLTDSRFSLPGTWVYVEPFKSGGSLTSKTSALIKSWWADTQADIVPSTRAHAETPWTAPTLDGSWVDYGGSWQVAQYRKVGDEVQLRGLIKSGNLGSAIFTLPSDFCPPADILIGTAAEASHALLSVTSSGVVTPLEGSTNWFSLTKCSFSTSEAA